MSLSILSKLHESQSTTNVAPLTTENLRKFSQVKNEQIGKDYQGNSIRKVPVEESCTSYQSSSTASLFDQVKNFSYRVVKNIERVRNTLFAGINITEAVVTGRRSFSTLFKIPSFAFWRSQETKTPHDSSQPRTGQLPQDTFLSVNLDGAEAAHDEYHYCSKTDC